VISAVVYQTLAPLVSGRVYPNTFRQPDGGMPVWPAIRYQIINSVPAADIEGTVGVELDDGTVQVDVVARTYGAMAVLRDQVIAAMQNTDPPCIRGPIRETDDAETKTHRCILEFTFYPSNALTGSP
jgi:hypothetical protein